MSWYKHTMSTGHDKEALARRILELAHDLRTRANAVVHNARTGDVTPLDVGTLRSMTVAVGLAVDALDAALGTVIPPDKMSWIAGKACESLAEISAICNEDTGKAAEAVMCDWTGAEDGPGENAARQIVEMVRALAGVYVDTTSHP